MKKLNLFVIALLFPVLAFSQVFNTASTLKPLKFSLGLEPCVYDNSFGLFLHGGVGIKSGIDFAMKYGILNGYDYFGADLEWRLMSGKPNISLVTGGHSLRYFGLDLGLNLSFPITSGVGLYTGLDLDINFPPDDVDLNAWIPVGVEIPMRNSMSFILEAEIPLSTYFVFGGGLAFYF